MTTKTITKATLIPLGLLGPIAAGVWWAAGIEQKVQANTKEVSRMEKIADDLSTIKTDVAVIKSEIKRIGRR